MPPCMCKVETFYCLLTIVLCSSTSYIISKEHKAWILSITLHKCVTTYWLQHNTMFQTCCIHCPCINWYRCNTFEFGAADSLSASFPGWAELGVILLRFDWENTRIQLYWSADNKNRNLPKQNKKLLLKSHSRNKSNMELSVVKKWSVMKSGCWGFLYWKTTWPFIILFSFKLLCYKMLIFLWCYLTENSHGVHVSTNISVKADACQHPAFQVIFHTGKHTVFTCCPIREGTPVTKHADVLKHILWKII